MSEYKWDAKSRQLVPKDVYMHRQEKREGRQRKAAAFHQVRCTKCGKLWWSKGTGRFKCNCGNRDAVEVN